MPRRHRYLGDLDAATDVHFKDHFCESRELPRLEGCHSDIVFGSKGVGKTALRRALAELHCAEFFATKTIDLDHISFAQVHDALSALRDTSKTEIATLARNTWRNVLAMYCLEAVAEHLPYNGALRQKILALLAEEDFVGRDSNTRLIGYIERLFLLVAEAGLEAPEAAPLGLTKHQRSLVNGFPSNPSVKALLEEASAAVAKTGKGVLICLDGFDSIVDHTPASRRAIFAGLIDAVHKSARDPLFARAFCFKAFLPQELTETAHAIVWDADKFIDHTHYIRWSEAEFQNFLKRRLLQYSKSRSNQFVDVWHEFMPDRVRNEVHRIDENSFQYVLRHTLYRPRQLLTHLQRILDRWDETSDAFRVDPTFIAPVVARTNYDLAQSVVNQLEVAHPGFDAFMRSWNGAQNVITVAQFQERLKKVFECPSAQEANQLFSALFNFGIFGIAPKAALAKGSQQTRFRFGFVGDRFAPNIHAAVEGSDFVGLSPMFHEFCGSSPSEYGAVIPMAN